MIDHSIVSAIRESKYSWNDVLESTKILHKEYYGHAQLPLHQILPQAIKDVLLEAYIQNIFSANKQMQMHFYLVYTAYEQLKNEGKIGNDN